MRRARAAVLVLLLLPLAGSCLSRGYPEKQRFVLDLERAQASSTEGNGTLRMEAVRVARSFERKGFVYRTGEATYEHDFYNEFFSPPGSLLYEGTGRWLARSGVFGAVLGAREATESDWLMETRVIQLYADVRERSAPVSVVEVRFRVLDARSPTLAVAFDRLYRDEVRVERASAAALVAGWSEGVTHILTRLEADLAADLPQAGRRSR